MRSHNTETLTMPIRTRGSSKGSESAEMPKVKQPVLLKKVAFECLVNHIVTYCDRLSTAGESTRLRESIAVIKKHLHDSLPSNLFGEICGKFLHEFYEIAEERSDNYSGIYHKARSENMRVDKRTIGRRIRRPDSHYTAALEIIMDVKIAGLRCKGFILRFLDPAETHRILGLELLDLTGFWDTRPKNLENFRLQDLTTFIFPGLSNDDDLELIGSHCPKLQVLMIEESEFVTDRGLRGIHSCSELRVINLHYCKTSDFGVNEMLSVHKKLEEFNVGTYYATGEESFDILSRDMSFVCPSIKRFAIKSNPITDNHLKAVVTLFPNLTHLRICCELKGDIRVLKNLSKLTELNLSYGYTEASMYHLRELLIDIGANISFLGIFSANIPNRVSQDDINFIFKHCSNVEFLEFDYEPPEELAKLVIPPFRKLKHLRCIAVARIGGNRAVLYFGKMLELEKVMIQEFDDIFQMIESMIHDHEKFPNLKEVRTYFDSEDRIDHIMQIVKNNNLDFTIKYSD